MITTITDRPRRLRTPGARITQAPATPRPIPPTGERVLLLSMPFGPIERPSLGLGLLQAHCQRLAVSCETQYLTMRFAEQVGAAEYQWLTNHVPYTAFAGDWVFASALYGDRPEVDHRYVDDVLRGQWRLAEDSVDRLQSMRAQVEPFLGQCLETIDWDRYSMVGFTSVFQQNLASLALAARIKERHPDLTIAFGGANWEEPMGSALRRQFRFVDLAFSGEADRSFPAVLDARQSGRPVVGIPGVDAGDPELAGGSGSPDRVEDMDEVPIPDFDPFFDQLQASAALRGVVPTLLVETARGCWWGERSQCTFCGLNGSSMAFRSKSPGRAVEEIVALRRRYGAGTISVVDDILDMRYLRTVLPQLAEERLGADLFWEVKASLTYRQVAVLRAAGVVYIQPGVESLSDHVLDLMRKGITAARNIELLKWCREYGVSPLWNLLYGFPGETAEDYRESVEVIKSIWHLPAPSGYGAIRLDRFSPYHADPASFGMINVRPMTPLPDLYPFDRATQMEVAYYFEFDYDDGRQAETFADEAIALTREWIADSRPGSLWMRTIDDKLHLVDTRRQPASGLTDEPRRAVLDGWKAAVYLACDRAQDVATLEGLPEVERAGVGSDELRGFLQRCAANRLMIELHSRWLGLAVHTPARNAESRPSHFNLVVR